MPYNTSTHVGNNLKKTKPPTKMVDILNEQINSFLKEEVFSFSDVFHYERRIRRKNANQKFLLESFVEDVTDISDIKDQIYNRILILEQSSKSIYIKKFVDIISQYTDNYLESSLGIYILTKRGLKPKFNESSDRFMYSMMGDDFKLGFFELDNLDFDFHKTLDIYSTPYKQRLKKLKDFIIDYSSEFSGGITINNNSNKIISNKVFIVHGHNDGIKYELSQTLTKLGLVPVILHEQQNENKTIIEKIEANSDVRFAIVLLTDDDIGKAEKEDEFKPRARQNVIFEMGYFIGLLGRKNVCCLINNDKLEKPNDISGIVYINYNGNWVLQLAKELKSAGLNLNMNDLI